MRLQWPRSAFLALSLLAYLHRCKRSRLPRAICARFGAWPALRGQESGAKEAPGTAQLINGQ
eukprot:2367658-Prorocentrum_lima.AAC.1